MSRFPPHSPWPSMLVQTVVAMMALDWRLTLVLMTLVLFLSAMRHWALR